MTYKSQAKVFVNIKWPCGESLNLFESGSTVNSMSTKNFTVS